LYDALACYDEFVAHTPDTRPHAAGAGGDNPAVPEPSYAERARTLMHLGRVGALSTLSRKQPGYPFGSVMPYALDTHGRPIFLISSMAMHRQNLAADSRSSLLVTESETASDPLGAARITVMGSGARVPDSDLTAVRNLYLQRHENARYWVDFEDFAFYRLDVIDVYFVGGFGVMGWVTAEAYTQAEPDPLADVAAGIVQHMNTDHTDALLLIAKELADSQAEQATMTAIDRLGFHVRLKSGQRVHGARIAFPREVRNTQDARSTLVEMVRQARGITL
jgi:putative heme iron utilization protein